MISTGTTANKADQSGGRDRSTCRGSPCPAAPTPGISPSNGHISGCDHCGDTANTHNSIGLYIDNQKEVKRAFTTATGLWISLLACSPGWRNVRGSQEHQRQLVDQDHRKMGHSVQCCYNPQIPDPVLFTCHPCFCIFSYVSPIITR